jgi:hypothetical protein
MGGMMAMAGGPGGGPRARRDLTALVGKLELVTRGLHLELTAEQVEKLSLAVKELDSQDEMTEEQAEKHLNEIKGLLDGDNQKLLESFELPRRAPSGGQGGGGGGGGRSPVMAGGPPPSVNKTAPPPSVGPVGAGGGPGGGGGAAQASDQNPFKQEENAKRLKGLRDRLDSPPAKPATEAPKS